MEVEILDVSDGKARALLLSIDPLAALAENQEQLQTRLRELTPAVNPELCEMWERAAAGAIGPPPEPRGRDVGSYAHQYFVLIVCRDDIHQRELLARFSAEGLKCQAKLC